MSKNIDWTQPLSDDERAWAEQFPGAHAGLLEANAQQFPATAEPSLEGEDDEAVPYTEWTVSELQSEIKRRNNEEGKALLVPAKKADAIKVLEDDDAAAER
jgi:hypothetical protein